MTLLPTPQTYSELQTAYDHFNRTLFDGSLPPCLMTLQRKRSTYGYFSGGRFVNAEGTITDEIALNPQFFAVLPVREIMQTLAHEMVHVWQHHHGKPGRRRYHNKEWAAKMEAIGLMPSSTGKPGGKMTGECMADYVIESGAFAASAAKLLDGKFQVSWMDRFTDAVLLQGIGGEDSLSLGANLVSAEQGGVLRGSRMGASNRLKFRCPSCHANAWGKPTLCLICGNCSVQFQPVGA